MRYQKYLKESNSYWKYPTESDMKSDFAEYKVKEYSKWEQRAKDYGFKFPIFNDFNDFKKSIKQAKVTKLTNKLHKQIPNNSDLKNIDSLTDLVHSYHRPRDIDRIVKGFKNKEKIPYPIILKGSKGYFRLAGNTRTNTAKILNIPVNVLIIDVSK